MFQALCGMLILWGMLFLFSQNRREIPWREIVSALGFQGLLILLFFWFPGMQKGLQALGQIFLSLRLATLEATQFLFGYLAGGPTPFDVTSQGPLFLFFFQALPTILVVSALAMLGFHWGIIPRMVQCLSWILKPMLSLRGPVSLCAGAQLFLGQTDAPLLCKPYLQSARNDELFLIMVMGMATTAASITPVYASLLDPFLPHAMSHILMASVINIPASVAIAKMLMPARFQGENPKEDAIVSQPYVFSNSMDAIAQGTQQGMGMMMGVTGMLLVTLALMALLNAFLGWLTPLLGWPALTLQMILGWLLMPVTWLMGIPADEMFSAGPILGLKVALNEVTAFLELQHAKPLSQKTLVILTYALSGFGNVSSIAIQIGGLGILVPERKQDIIALAPKAMVAGCLASAWSGLCMGLWFN